MDREFLTVDDVATDLRSGGFPIGANSIRKQAREDATKLGFPVCVIGNKVLIPRQGYENWKEGKYVHFNNHKTAC